MNDNHLLVRRARGAALAIVAVGAAACSDTPTTAPTRAVTPTGPAAQLTPDHDDSFLNLLAAGGVFVSTNATNGNAIVAYARGTDGKLTPSGTFSTGGNGTGGTTDPLQSQGAVALTPDHTRLFVVNAGSNSITEFLVLPRAKLLRVATFPSRGSMPVSLSVSNDRLYVLNAGSNSVAGYSIDFLLPIPRPLTTPPLVLGPVVQGASTIGLSPDEKTIIVSERDANLIDVISVGRDGVLTLASTTAAHGGAPFGFDFTEAGQLVLSEAAGAAPSGAASSYTIGRNGKLNLVSGSVSTQQAATCWLIVGKGNHFAYAANAGSGSISGFAIGSDASLKPLNADGRTGVTDASATPIDIGVSRDGKFLYALETGAGGVGAFTVHGDGSLTSLATVTGLARSGGLQGLAAY
jgi:6-phosphogluconolactonase